MNFTKTMFALAIGSVGIMGAMSAHAVDMNAGDILTINASALDGSGYVVLGTGSYFGMDSNKNGIIAKPERVGLAQGTTGVTIGAASTTPGAVTDTWYFFGNPGTDYLTSAVTGGTGGVNMSGWTVTWNGIPTIPMGSGAWGAGYTSGVANFAWDGVYGNAYTLDYHATVPVGDASGFGGVQYALHLEGTVTQAAAVPEASTYGMMLAGLGLVGFAVRRRKLV